MSRSPRRLCPPYGSPNYYRETGLNPPGRTLTAVQIGHLETAFNLLCGKVRDFTHKVGSNAELRGKFVRLALDRLILEDGLDPLVLAQLERSLPSQAK